MHRRVAPLVAACVLTLTVTPVIGAPAVDPATRTVIVGPFVVKWSLTNPEAIVRLSWNGSSNLTNAWVHPNCPSGGVHEFFGNSWGDDNDTDFVSPVGWGSAGGWSQHGPSGVDIESAASAGAASGEQEARDHDRNRSGAER